MVIIKDDTGMTGTAPYLLSKGYTSSSGSCNIEERAIITQAQLIEEAYSGRMTGRDLREPMLQKSVLSIVATKPTSIAESS